MSKPTPGPYKITPSLEIISCEREHCRVPIAKFLDGWVGRKHARANAKSFVKGMAALEKLERIRAAVSTWQGGRVTSGLSMVEVSKLLGMERK